MPSNTKYFSTLLEFSHEFRETPNEKGQPGTVVYALIPALGKLKIRKETPLPQRDRTPNSAHILVTILK